MSDEEKELAHFVPQITVRRVWFHDEWYYSVVDIIAVLTQSTNPADYWRKLRGRAKSEGFEETLTQIVQLKLKAADGRFRLTDTASRQTLLRLIQSIPSPRAEPIRLWLAQVGEESIEEIEHPEIALERVRKSWRTKGYDDAWIEARIKSDLIRNELTDEWHDRGAKEGLEYAILTNELTKGTFGLSVQTYKEYKLLPNKGNLRDHMTPIELALTSLSEATAITNHRERDSQGFDKLKRDVIDAGTATGEARKALEKARGKPVVSSENYLHLKQGRKRRKEEISSNTEKSTPTLFDE